LRRVVITSLSAAVRNLGAPAPSRPLAEGDWADLGNPVFGDQAAENLLALDPGSDVDDAAGLTERGLLLQCLVRPVAVVVAGVLGQHLPQMPFAEDQHVVQALAAQRAHEPLRECVRPRRPDRRPDHPRAVPGEDLIERGGELAILVADHELEPLGSFTEVHEKVRACCAVQAPVGWAVTPRMCTARVSMSITNRT
jgi:hypothetical protein